MNNKKVTVAMPYLFIYLFFWGGGGDLNFFLEPINLLLKLLPRRYSHSAVVVVAVAALIVVALAAVVAVLVVAAVPVVIVLVALAVVATVVPASSACLKGQCGRTCYSSLGSSSPLNLSVA